MIIQCDIIYNSNYYFKLHVKYCLTFENLEAVIYRHSIYVYILYTCFQLLFDD